MKKYNKALNTDTQLVNSITKYLSGKYTYINKWDALVECKKIFTDAKIFEIVVAWNSAFNNF